jgi:hypothetical protein
MEKVLITLEVGSRDFIAMRDALRDCGCKTCLRLINNLEAQRAGQTVKCCFGCGNAVTASEATYHETYRLCQLCYPLWVEADEQALFEWIAISKAKKREEAK